MELNRSFGDATTESDSDSDLKPCPKHILKESNLKANNSHKLPEWAKLTTDLEGKKIDVLVGPAQGQQSIIWLVKFCGNQSLDLVSGHLMNKYFAPNMIRYYETRIVYQPKKYCVMVDLRIRNAALKMFED